MSYSMTHLVIANSYAKRHCMEPSEEAMFLLASISPDAVHANIAFNKKMKGNSHCMPNEIEWGNIYLEEQMDSWYKAVGEFYKGRYSESLTSLELAFLKGYTIHLFVDICNCQWFYAPHLIQYGLDVGAFRKEYREQSIAYDKYLYQNFSDAVGVFGKIESAASLFTEKKILESLQMQDILLEQDVLKNIERTKKQYIDCDVPCELSGTMITIRDSEAFIREMGKKCDSLLFDFPLQEKLFQVGHDGNSI